MSAPAQTLRPPSRTLMFLEGRAIHELPQRGTIKRRNACRVRALLPFDLNDPAVDQATTHR